MANNVLIFGDSYSTFENFIPDGYAAYYTKAGHPGTDVRRVEETWWHQVITKADMNLILNNSWSGSTICYTGYNNTDCSQSSSFIYRLRKLIEQGFFEKNKVDTVFVFGGTNDSWADASIGTLKYGNWNEKDLYSVLPAISYFLKTLKDKLPEARIYCLINTELKSEIFEGMREACRIYGITEITFDAIDKECGHPTIKGMQDIKNTVLNIINRK